MDIIRRLIAASLWVLAAVVGFHFVFSPVYGHVLDVGLIWRILSWVMTVGIVVVLAIQYARKRVPDRQGADARVSAGNTWRLTSFSMPRSFWPSGFSGI